MKPILTIIFLIVSFLIMFFLSWSEYQDLRQAMLESEIKNEDLNNMRIYNQLLEDLSGKLKDDYRNDLKKIIDGVPDDHYAPSLFSEIRRISYKTGVRVGRLGSFSVRNHSSRSDIREIEINFQVEGAYSNFKTFLSEIGKSARMMTIKQVRIEGRSSLEKRETLLEYSITIKTYSY